MDTSVTIMGLVITILIGIPLYFVFNSNSVNKAKIKTILSQYSENNPDNFGLIETQNKKTLALDKKGKGFLLMDFSATTDRIAFVNLKEISSCQLTVHKEKNSDTILKIDFEFQNKVSNKTETVPFYSIENDQIGQVCLHEDHQMAKKWVVILQENSAKNL